jgi:hypothetical protein
VWERIWERDNLLTVLTRVETNGVAPGIDGMMVDMANPFRTIRGRAERNQHLHARMDRLFSISRYAECVPRIGRMATTTASTTVVETLEETPRPLAQLGGVRCATAFGA